MPSTLTKVVDHGMEPEAVAAGSLAWGRACATIADRAEVVAPSSDTVFVREPTRFRGDASGQPVGLRRSQQILRALC
jgi:hypothetical protein